MSATPDRTAAREAIDAALIELVNALEHTLAVCDQHRVNLPEMLSSALSQIALEHGSYRLVEHRPGSWEAEHVRALDVSELFRP